MKSGDSALIESFLDMMSAERGASINTLSAYRRDLLDFSGHRAAKGGSAKPASRDDIKSYLGVLSRSASATSFGIAPVFRISLFGGRSQGRSNGRDRSAEAPASASQNLVARRDERVAPGSANPI